MNKNRNITKNIYVIYILLSPLLLRFNERGTEYTILNELIFQWVLLDLFLNILRIDVYF